MAAVVWKSELTDVFIRTSNLSEVDPDEYLWGSSPHGSAESPRSEQCHHQSRWQTCCQWERNWRGRRGVWSDMWTEHQRKTETNILRISSSHSWFNLFCFLVEGEGGSGPIALCIMYCVRGIFLFFKVFVCNCYFLERRDIRWLPFASSWTKQKELNEGKRTSL